MAKSDHCILVVGATMGEIMKGTADVNVMIGCDVSWDRDLQMWRADWEGGMQVGNSKHEAVINAFRQRLGIDVEQS